jgi:hypothetical protein
MLGRDAPIILVENVFAKENPICDSGGGLVQFYYGEPGSIYFRGSWHHPGLDRPNCQPASGSHIGKDSDFPWHATVTRPIYVIWFDRYYWGLLSDTNLNDDE